MSRTVNVPLLVSSAVLVGANLGSPPPAAAASCESLRTLSLPHTTITLAQTISDGTFVPPGAQTNASLTNLPSFCRIAASLSPTNDSDIRIEVWLPTENWNAKFQAVGNGGWAGSVSYAAMQRALQEGYATASTDTGHTGANTRFAFGHPEKMIDFAYRAVHEMTVASKVIVAAFYGQAARLSYWTGCSTGGRQGLMAAQRYPEDFDGIIAGAPANYMTHLSASHIATGVAVLREPASSLTPRTYEVLNKAVVAACDARDGVKDGLLADPRACRFDPTTLLCRAGDSGECLTAPQAEAVKKVYAPTTKANGELIYPALQPGSELAWGPVTAGPTPFGISMWMFRYLHDDENWDWRTFDLDRDTALANEKAGFTNALQTDLSAFKKRGGKLLLYHGWNDHLIAPENTVNYYSGVLSTMGGTQADWIRLFMAPGMQHCNGGPGPNQINWLAALERWREAGDAPDQIPAYRVTNNRVDMTRPLCPYPQLAVYKGVGSTNDAANFVCRRP
jgi:feruloyl esterase